ncbi:hypothetical protein [Celerinatantimonas diazotrophica]|uniref:Uncharacterized protein n=1 Tax=Celerinatantimonas diazotrophica TaxID=412034 RepID=A0A4V6NEE2_9GAMM|nr:hypothetical protein [Celerinatantimonas diazotrophica]TCK58991.1 hypothetical protein EV690_1154 [Celerinatantimonas diazotrophica]CAG9297626.1 hypothetical protein CEDIAZO_02814 [Celerinatantimonas diazotrophica]
MLLNLRTIFSLALAIHVAVARTHALMAERTLKIGRRRENEYSLYPGLSLFDIL